MASYVTLVCDVCAKETRLTEAVGSWVRVVRNSETRHVFCGVLSAEKRLTGEHICPKCVPKLRVDSMLTPGANPYPVQLEHGTL